MLTYGSLNEEWGNIGPTSNNFHSGVDFAKNENEDLNIIYSVEAGEVSHIYPHDPGASEYRIVITPTGDDEGWYYKHLDGQWGEPWVEQYYEGAPIAEGYDFARMESNVDPEHLHFERSIAEPPFPPPETQNALDNPLDYLFPEATSANGLWIISSSNAGRPIFFLPEYLAFDDPNNQDWENLWSNGSEVISDTLDREQLAGKVDIFYNVYCDYDGEIGFPAQTPGCYSIPNKIKWTLSSFDGSLGTWVEVFTKYVAHFDGPLGGEDTWEECKRFYFRYLTDAIFGPENPASIVCLTNCNDNSTWNGVYNIEENCWNTALSAEGSGEAYHPLNMQTPDGVYQIQCTSYAWDENVTHDYETEVVLSNNREIAQEVRLSDAATDQDIWHAEWVASYDTDGFEPVKNVYVNQTTEPGTTLDIEIVFSGPMSTSVAAWVRFTKPEGGYIVASPGSPEWTSTNQPDGYVDTWHGTVDVPAEGFSGWMTMKIKAHDISDLGLLDPSIAYPDPPSPTDEEYTDDHHGFGIAVTPEPGWPVFLEHYVSGSPVAGDLDGDGDMDIAVQSKEGMVELIDESGAEITPALESGDWSGYNYPLVSSPAIADLDLDGDMEVIAVHPYGANAWHAESGSAVSEWPVDMGIGAGAVGIYPARSAPVVCDLIGDAHPEIVLCRHLDDTQPNAVCTVWMFGHDGGSRIWQTMLETGGVSVASTPAAGDISYSHAGNEILVCTSDGYVSNYPYPPPDGGRDWNSALYLLEASDGDE
ncbi:MAG: hypothetical protein GF388_00865, partial [Candidatus Aegiribacteria sp.]|nr:hypothetical protein [Candidatus Aegiribacteria sp.]